MFLGLEAGNRRSGTPHCRPGALTLPIVGRVPSPGVNHEPPRGGTQLTEQLEPCRQPLSQVSGCQMIVLTHRLGLPVLQGHLEDPLAAIHVEMQGQLRCPRGPELYPGRDFPTMCTASAQPVQIRTTIRRRSWVFMVARRAGPARGGNLRMLGIGALDSNAQSRGPNNKICARDVIGDVLTRDNDFRGDL